MKFYKKEGRNQVFFSDGSKAEFTAVGPTIALFEVDDSVEPGSTRAKEMDHLAAKKMGGIVVLTADEYADLKKKLATINPNESARVRQIKQAAIRLFKPEQVTVLGSPNPPTEPVQPVVVPGEAAVAVTPVEPAKAPDTSEPKAQTSFTPRRGRASKAAGG